MKKAILITGVTSGLGKALVPKLLGHGFKVFGLARTQPRHDESEALGTPSEDFVFLPADLGNPDALKGLKGFIKDPLYAFIHCAGYGTYGSVVDIPIEEYQTSLQVNYLSAVQITKLFYEDILSQNGVFSYVGSGVAKRALPFWAPYCASKAALLSFADSLRVEVRSRATVHYFSPGPINTKFQHAVRAYSKKPMFPSMGKDPHWIADVFLKTFLAQKERVFLGREAKAASYLNHWAPSLTDWILSKKFKDEPTRN